MSKADELGLKIIEKELKMLDEHFTWGYMPYVEYEHKKRELERRLEKEVNDERI